MWTIKEARQNFARRLRSIRKSKEITQEQLAELIGRSTEHISFLERGERSPSFEIIVDIANLLGVLASDLLRLEDPIIDSFEGSGIDSIIVAPVSPTLAESIEESPTSENKRISDLERLENALRGIREMQQLADEYGIRDILQDNGGKVLQLAILLGLRISPSREGNDAMDLEGNEYELKTVNRALAKNRGITTHHHLTTDIINKYRAVKAWFVAVYEGIELMEIYKVEPQLLEPLFQKWQTQFELEGKPLNNPKIPMNYVKKGELVYPISALKAKQT